MKEVLVTIPVNDEQKARIEAAAQCGSEQCRFTYRPADDLEATELESFHAIIGSVAPHKLVGARKLEWLQLSWAGSDAFCTPGILADKVVLCNASGAYGLACSEQLLALLFALIREIPLYVRQQEQRLWRQSGNIISVEGSTVLVLGLGDIGGDFARKVKALGAYVIGVRRNASVPCEHCDEVISLADLDTVLPRADIVANSLPGTDETTGLLDERRLRLMKQDAYFVNVGRGNVLDQEALKRVLSDGHLAGVGLDVFEQEPLPAEDGLWAMSQVLITPHVAGQLYLPETLERIVDIACGNLSAWVRGEELSHVVDRVLGY